MIQVHITLKILVLSCAFIFSFYIAQSQVSAGEKNPALFNDLKFYPFVYDTKPDIPSPFTISGNIETVLIVTKEGKYGIVPVTVENGEPLLYSRKIKTLIGKDQQLEVGAADFPELARTGLHSEADLDKKKWITGIPVSIITVIGRPNGFSNSGFMAADEDIISVLKGDNHLVRTLGFTHPQMAKPLFHIWNIILKEIELGKLTRFYDNIRYIYYNEHKLSLKVMGTKGWQMSIFQDEIQGSMDIDINRELSNDEQSLLNRKYPHLTNGQRSIMQNKLSSIHFSEMAPYYIMRYGFYEGHTDYRCDPVAIAFIFGLKNLEGIEKAFKENLYNVLTTHFIPK